MKTGLAYALGTWFGSGYCPLAPGTAGALATWPLFFVLKRSHPLLFWGFTTLTTVIGIWASQVVAEHRRDSDPSLVVIDEVAGVLIAMGLVRQRSLASQLAAFVLFRVLDILKPGPVARAEKLQPKGLGIMADDLLAGVIAGAVARAVLRR